MPSTFSTTALIRTVVIILSSGNFRLKQTLVVTTISYSLAFAVTESDVHHDNELDDLGRRL